MFRTVLGFLAFWIILIISLVLFIPYGFMLIFHLHKIRNSYTDVLLRCWGIVILTLGGIKLTVIGRDKIPKQRNLVFISNHQGMFDIPVLIAGVSHCVGFIAKKQLLYTPIISFWMMAIHCVFLDRRNIHAAAKVIEKGAENIRKGYPMAIFPEGTRSRGKGMGPFKKGSLKLALLAEATIIPVTIRGTYEIFERQKYVTAGKVSIEFHDPIVLKTINDEEKKDLMDKIRESVASGLTERKN